MSFRVLNRWSLLKPRQEALMHLYNGVCCILAAPPFMFNFKMKCASSSTEWCVVVVISPLHLLHPNHFKEALTCPSTGVADLTLTSLYTFIKLLAADQTTSAVIPYLCRATLLAVRKKNGGLRPIAVGEVLRQLTSKCMAFLSNSCYSSSLTARS